VIVPPITGRSTSESVFFPLPVCMSAHNLIACCHLLSLTCRSLELGTACIATVKSDVNSLIASVLFSTGSIPRRHTEESGDDGMNSLPCSSKLGNMKTVVYNAHRNISQAQSFGSTMTSLPISSITTAYATASAGMHPAHTLPKKLRAIADAGFTAVEIAFPDLEAYAASLKPDYENLNSRGEGDLKGLLDATKKIKILVDNLGLDVLTLMPLVLRMA
jgi:hypothetical protein